MIYNLEKLINKAKQDLIFKICEQCTNDTAQEGLSPDCEGFQCSVWKISKLEKEKPNDR